MNKINILEIYYGIYREIGKRKAEETLSIIYNLPITITDTLTDEIFKEAGPYKC